MGRKFWGTREQLRLLRRNKKVYYSYRAINKTRLFWPKLFKLWFTKYPGDKVDRVGKEKVSSALILQTHTECLTATQVLGI